MSDVAADVATLKTSISGILSKYKIHPDDRDIILEKIDEAMIGVINIQKTVFETELSGIRSEIDIERKNVRNEVDGIRNSAISKLDRIQQEVEDAYEEGVQDGLSQTPQSKGLGSFTVILGIFFAALAVTVVANSLFSKKKDD